MDVRAIDIQKYCEGVERNVYRVSVPGHAAMVAVVAADAVEVLGRRRCGIKYRGQIATRIAEFFLNVTEDIVANFMLPVDAGLPANVLLGEYCRVVPVKFVVRRYFTGSVFGEYVGEGDLPNYYRFGELQLMPVVRTADGYAPIAEGEIVACGYLTPEEMMFVREKCFELFRRGECLASKVGLTLADTVFEFGWNEYGHLMLADEVLTPDCSQYWQVQDVPYSDENPPRVERLSAFLDAWVGRQAERRGVGVDDVELTAHVRREAYYAYTALYMQIFGFPFSPGRVAQDSVRALKSYLERDFG